MNPGRKPDTEVQLSAGPLLRHGHSGTHPETEGRGAPASSRRTTEWAVGTGLLLGAMRTSWTQARGNGLQTLWLQLMPRTIHFKMVNVMSYIFYNTRTCAFSRHRALSPVERSSTPLRGFWWRHAHRRVVSSGRFFRSSTTGESTVLTWGTASCILKKWACCLFEYLLWKNVYLPTLNWNIYIFAVEL